MIAPLAAEAAYRAARRRAKVHRSLRSPLPFGNALLAARLEWAATKRFLCGAHLASSLVVSTCLVSACFPSGGGGNPAGDTPPPVWITHNVRVNTVGYTTGHAKVATVVLPDGMTTALRRHGRGLRSERQSPVGLPADRPLHRRGAERDLLLRRFFVVRRPGDVLPRGPGARLRRDGAVGPVPDRARRSGRRAHHRDDRNVRPALRHGGEDHDGERHLAARRLPPARRRFAQVPDRRRHTVSQRRRLARCRRLRQVRQQRRLQRGDAARGLGAFSADARGAGAPHPRARQEGRRRGGPAARFPLGGEVGARLAALRPERQRRQRRSPRQADGPAFRALRHHA